ncbi:hypothetical protein TG4357_01949 [Thalassovita gelatinovora]|uniref:Uncharacterized protein n=1 Tax=Thalassovita gelatinovora TaxID=53501 RepID=A0A0P1FBI3_THAGE|nr:hypothetical protein TG4357_01949 [Thalassovita gelatinovora]
MRAIIASYTGPDRVVPFSAKQLLVPVSSVYAVVTAIPENRVIACKWIKNVCTLRALDNIGSRISKTRPEISNPA